MAIVEKWNPFGGPMRPDGSGRVGRRNDLFGIIDVLALDPERGVVGVQSCGQDFSGHLKKMQEEQAQEVRDWIRTPGTQLELWGWRKIKKVKGGKAMIWEPRIYVFLKKEFGG